MREKVMYCRSKRGGESSFLESSHYLCFNTRRLIVVAARQTDVSIYPSLDESHALLSSFRMNNNICIILLLLVALLSCAFSSYLDIPPPPERPLRFKTKEQIETYLKAVKDYYDAFKIKLVRRESLFNDADSNQLDRSVPRDEKHTNAADDYEQIYHLLERAENFPPHRRFRMQRPRNLQ